MEHPGGSNCDRATQAKWSENRNVVGGRPAKLQWCPMERYSINTVLLRQAVEIAIERAWEAA